MASVIDIEKFKATAKLADRYPKQLHRLQMSEGVATGCIEAAVEGAVAKCGAGKTALVVYGEPQSGKTEMMICLTAKLLDGGNRAIVHLMNDSVDLLTQNLQRFQASGLAPAPRNSSELTQGFALNTGQELVVFCKKNARDLEKLIERLQTAGRVVVIDDEADYATPNAKINKGTKTKINGLIEQLIGANGCYIGVTATPARLDLNNTFQNDTDKWVHFPPHDAYTGQNDFFPLSTQALPFRLTFLDDNSGTQAARDALVRFLVTVAYMNREVNAKEQNYTMLVHTSGKKQDHEADRVTIAQAAQSLLDADSAGFVATVTAVHATASNLYPLQDADQLTEYVVANASRVALVVLNSERDRKSAGDNPTKPSSPFTVIIGGNIVSRGVTFPNLLAMYFTRNVSQKLQQDTYIQRARMFGARGNYLKHFELTIPQSLYADWHRCFVFHRLALSTVKAGLGSPVWIGDKRVAVASSASIDKTTVAMDRGEMSFAMFDFDAQLDAIVQQDVNAPATLRALREVVGNDALPEFLIQYIEHVAPNGVGSLGIHASSSIAGYESSADQNAISRTKGFIGTNQLEKSKPQYANAVHHVKILRNEAGKARVFYKYQESVQFIQNMKAAIAQE
jgi:hypothetical protein